MGKNEGVVRAGSRGQMVDEGIEEKMGKEGEREKGGVEV